MIQFYMGDSDDEADSDGPRVVKTATYRNGPSPSTATLIVDSSANGVIFPMEWCNAGSEPFEKKVPLQDAQGRSER